MALSKIETPSIDDNQVSAAKLHSSAIVDKLGYTPVTNTNPSFNGIIHQNGISIGHNITGGHGNASVTYKICSVQSYYWGDGGVIIEVWRRYYSGFGYAKYRIDGHGATPYGPGYTLNAVTTSGSYPSVSLSGLITTATESTAQYVNVLVNEGPYQASTVRVTTAGIVMREPGYTTGTNRVIMYNNFTQN